jgi:hypothetical protein
MIVGGVILVLALIAGAVHLMMSKNNENSYDEQQDTEMTNTQMDLA